METFCGSNIYTKVLRECKEGNNYFVKELEEYILRMYQVSYILMSKMVFYREAEKRARGKKASQDKEPMTQEKSQVYK